MKTMVQLQLESDTARLTCWVDQDHRVQVGSVISLKGDDDRRWNVVRVSNPHSASDIKHGWSNNI
jgi:hypothetical protein